MAEPDLNCVVRVTHAPLQVLYSSDFGSERFLGLFLSNNETSSAAHVGFFTLPSLMICFALSFWP